MSIVIGLTKGNTQKDREVIRPIISKLVEAGYIRHIVANDEDITLQTFTEEENEILPAYLIDRLTKKNKNGNNR